VLYNMHFMTLLSCC